MASIGMGCRFPGGSTDHEALWRFWKNGVDAIRDLPAERWNVDDYYNPNPDTPGKMYTRWGGFLNEVDKFDAQFFGIAPREAMSMDPQQRLLLEGSWEALEHAGQVRDGLAVSQTSVFVGISSNAYARFPM